MTIFGQLGEGEPWRPFYFTISAPGWLTEQQLNNEIGELLLWLREEYDVQGRPDFDPFVLTRIERGY